MPYLLLIIGLLIAGLALYRFMLKASGREILTLFLAVLLLALSGALFVLAVTGRLPAAIALVAALWPMIIAWWRTRRKKSGAAPGPAPSSGLSHAEALEILGLKEGATTDEIIEAHHRLMKKLHPDQDGSEGLAKQLNAAKDLLLGA